MGLTTVSEATEKPSRRFYRAADVKRIARKLMSNPRTSVSFASPMQEAKYRPQIVAAQQVNMEVSAAVAEVKRARTEI